MPCVNCCKRHRLNQADESEPSTSGNASQVTCHRVPEELLTVVTGTWDYWSIVVHFLLAVVMMFYGFNLFASEFFFPRHIKFNCSKDESPTGQSSCYISNGSKCEEFVFQHLYGYTLTEKWNLVCCKHIQVIICNFIFSCGLAVGFIITGFLADRWGRKQIFVLSIILQTSLGLLLSVSNTYSFFTVGRCFYGFALSGSTLVAIILSCEISSNKWRTFHLGVLCLAIAVGHTILPYIWMMSKHSLKNFLLICVPQIGLLFFVRVLRESPSWLLCKNQTSEAESILLKVANFNRMNLPSAFRIRPVQITHTQSAETVNLFNMLVPSNTRFQLIAFYLTFLLTSFVCGLLMKHILEVNEDLTLAMTFSGASNIFAAVVTVVLLYLMQHKVIIAAASVLGCFATVLEYIVYKDFVSKELALTGYNILVLAYLSFSVTYFTLWNITPRLFPTEIRGQGTGTALALSQLSFGIAGTVLHNTYITLPVLMAITCSCTVIILLGSLILFSVHNRELPDVLQDCVKFKVACKPTRWTTIRSKSPTIDETEVKIVDFESNTSFTLEYLNAPFHFTRYLRRSSKKVSTAVTDAKPNK